MSDLGASDLGSPIQGITLYSFTRAFHARHHDLEGLVRKVAADGMGPGLEIIGFSSFRGFPDLDDAYVGRFRELVDETEEWWFPTDSVVLSGDVPVASGEAHHEVDVDLTLYIPYIVIGENEVLHIEEHDTKTMTLRQAPELVEGQGPEAAE